ncbi:pyridoxamine 5'-phosphate oxidase family protein [Halomonas halocynthiae]|uniref:pyridoxamine 5'-phosphate oxidase family protein n=1 Tax=Halomonas halocynthiae TaxID=176290 RepID=UPI00040877C6|nr:pyridoxamine 5'-phosphate oxidase family protein [Halomonas halocynthiae]
MKMIDYSEKSVLCWLATSDLDATPNVSPKEIFQFLNEDHMLIANIASPESERNIRSNPQVCVSFIDIFEQRGFKVKGSARVVTSSDTEWTGYLSILAELAGENFPINSIFEITVKSSSKILAPSYFLFPKTTPESQVKGALLTYNVQKK